MIAFLFSPLGKIAGGVMLIVALIVSGKLWLISHDHAVLQGYVLLSEKTAAEAKATKEAHDKQAAQQALEEARKRELSATQAKDDANAKLAQRIAADNADGCSWTSDDANWGVRHQ
jgi:hypothetical protein